jgi:hypothetical protein
MSARLMAPDAGEMAGDEAVFAGERQQALHHLLARVEHEKIGCRASAAEQEGSFRQLVRVRVGLGRASSSRGGGQPGRGEEAPPCHCQCSQEGHCFSSIPVSEGPPAGHFPTQGPCRGGGMIA